MKKNKINLKQNGPETFSHDYLIYFDISPLTLPRYVDSSSRIEPVRTRTRADACRRTNEATLIRAPHARTPPPRQNTRWKGAISIEEIIFFRIEKTKGRPYVCSGSNVQLPLWSKEKNDRRWRRVIFRV